MVKDNVATVTPVKVARSLGTEAVIESGLKEGDVVVTDGHLLLTDGAHVAVRQSRVGGVTVNISEACIRRPVMTTLITAALIVFGVFGYRLLSVAALPAVDFPTIQITANLPGASPETMGASVAGPIERQLSTIAGITSMTSTSSLGLSTIIIQFDLNRNIDGAALDVQTALTVAARRLPVEMTIPPYFRKVNPGDFSILLFSLISPTLPLSVVDDYAEITLAQQISQLPGIAQVLVFGAQKFAVRVQVDPIAAAARGIALDDVRNVVAKANSNTPVGTISGRDQNTTITATAAMLHADEYRNVVVAYRNGLPVKIGEVAKVVDCVENDVVANLYNNRAIDRAGDLQAARRQYGQDRRFHQGAPADLPRADPGGGQDGNPRRPFDVDPRVGRRRAGDARHRDRAGGPGDLPVPAVRGRDHHSRIGGADLAHRDLRGDVRIRLLHQQHDACWR